MSRPILLAILQAAACAHHARHEDPHPCDAYLELRYERVAARGTRPADPAGAELLVRCPDDPGHAYPELEYSIDEDRAARNRCGEVLPLAPGTHRVIVSGQPYYEQEFHPGERVELATSFRVFGC